MTGIAATMPAPPAPAGEAGPVLVVAAFAPELRALGRFFAGGKSGAQVPSRAVVGIGLVEAAAGTARLLARSRPRALLLVGTAGSYADQPPIGSAAIATTIHLASASVARGAAYLPEPLPAQVESAPELVQALVAATGLATAVVACPIGITREVATGKKIAKATGAALENLEAFAVARAAAAAEIPFAAVLGVANVVGPEAHAAWRAHGDKAAAAACAAVRKWLLAG